MRAPILTGGGPEGAAAPQPTAARLIATSSPAVSVPPPARDRTRPPSCAPLNSRRRRPPPAGTVNQRGSAVKEPGLEPRRDGDRAAPCGDGSGPLFLFVVVLPPSTAQQG